MQKLVVVPTPVGNLKDITLRAIEILKSVDFILCEDTRTTGFLLQHFEISASMVAYHKFNEHQIVDKVIKRILNGEKAALTSDAGTPGISDPGYLVVSKCIENNIEVETLPGATAFVPALINSGFPNHHFVFEGFLPQKKGRQTRLKILAEETRTIILYESPFRIIKLLEEIVQFIGNERKVSLSRELSKMFEETVRDYPLELIQYFKQKPPKGEFVVVISAQN
jgi:16S rRNA (cytidine1402-2'-O)-methyltransferase